MSKLFDQLKDAARSREEKSPGLLVDALKRQQEGSAPIVAPAVALGAPAATDAPVAPAKAGAQSPSRISSFSGIGLALLIFIVAILAWRSAPFTPPKKLKIDPSELRLDRSLDLQRPGADRPTPKGTSSPGRPS